MKTILQNSLVALLLLFAVKSFSQITITENFKAYTTAEGLVDNDVTDLLIQNDSLVWIATASGLSQFDGVNFTNYTSINSGMNSDNILELEFCQNKLWMVTDSGISSYDGISFTNYTPSNGLISASILGLAATSTDTLWMTSTSGTSKFDGNTFTNYPAQSGRDIETDSLDRVYVMRATVANAFPFARLYENGVWSMPTQSGINFGINGAKLIKTATNKLYVAGIAGNPTRFLRIDYPLSCVPQSVYMNGTLHSNLTGNMVNPQQFEELNGLHWMGAGSNAPFYVVSSDSNYVNQYVGNSLAVSSCIKAKGGLLAVGSDKGVYFTSPTIKRANNKLEFAVNSIRTSVTITDPLFSNLLTGQANFEFPKDSNSHGIYSANFIVAAKKANQVNSYTVHPTNYFLAAFNNGPITSSGGLAQSFMVRVTKQEVISHQSSFNLPGYVIPDGIKNWPAYGDTTLGVAKDLAPFYDSNNNNCYDPQNGDYPIIKGDEALYWINHPNNPNLPFEYHWMMYAYANPSNAALNQSLFVQYTIVNRSNDIYDSVKVGFGVDGDVGNPADDYVGSDSLNNLLYFYNGDTFDESVSGLNGFRNMAPAVGVKFLSDSMSSAIYYNVGNATNGDPQTEQDWINYLNARWKNGQPITYGGNGFNSFTSAVPTNYMFTGDPVSLTGWSELTPGSSSPANIALDRRLLGSIPAFSLQPNERKTIEIAVGYGRTSNTALVIGKNVPEMKRLLNEVESFWDTLTVPVLSFATNDSCNIATSIEELISSQKNVSVFPIPSSGDLTIEAEEQIRLIEVYDMKGAKVMSLSTRQNKAQLSLSDYRDGFYLIRVQLEDDTWLIRKVIKQQ